MRSSLLVLVTGDPVPPVQAERGGFVELIRATVGDAWAGDWVVHDVREGALEPQPRQWAGVIITGSPASLTERVPWMDQALIYVRGLVEAEVPTFGICFGHQMLGEALGGRVERNPAGREIGTVTLRVNEASRLLPVAGERGADVPVNMTHLDSVVRLPAGAKVLASTEREPHAYVRFGPEAWGVQFHPEMDVSVIRHYIRHRQQDLGSEGMDVEELLSSASETPHAVSMLQRFVQRVSEKAAERAARS